MKKSSLSLAIVATLSTFAAHAGAGLLDNAALAWEYKHSATGGYLAEIVSHDVANNQVWVSGVSGVDILNARTGAFVQRIDVSSFGSVNSVAIHNGVAALAIENTTNRALPGVVQLYSTATRSLLSGTNAITVGALPDMLTFTKDGSKLLVANEATPSAGNYGARTTAANVYPARFGNSATDPVGTVSIIDMASRAVTATANPNLASVTRTGSAIRTNTGMDLEPEYIAVNHTGTKAYVSLQEANAVGVLNLQTGQFESVVGLGLKDFAASGNAIDSIDTNNSNVFTPKAVNAKGLYMPDGLATYEANGRTYIVTANEGDFREDDEDRVRGNATGLGGTGDLARLRVSNTDSSPGSFVAAGGRSFSILNELGEQVFDSGNLLELAAAAAGIYDDGRSADKGVEPEGVEIMEINGRKIAFIGLERTLKAAIAAFDITDPSNVTFLKLLTSNLARAPEGLRGFRDGDDYYLTVSSEGANAATGNYTTTFYLATAVPEPETNALVLAGAAVLVAAARRRRRQQA
jgi:hypothetical protein